jgi:L-lactate dehydrogenase complex protein LldG
VAGEKGVAEVNPSTGDRDAILGRIAEALREEAPRHYETMGKPPAGVTAPFREWLPPVGESTNDLVARFAQQSEVLKTEFVECASIAGAAKHVSALAKAGQWKTIALHSGELSTALVAKLPESLGTLVVDQGYEKNALEACDAGLTECEALVAQMGSVCVTARSAGGRALSVLPPHHIVIARREQFLPDLSAAYELLARKYGQRYPSFISFITGPSRTGDIERILVLGAHGPKRLTVLVVP